MKIPKFLYLIIIILIGFEVYNTYTSHKEQQQMKAQISSLRGDLRQITSITDSIIMVNDRITKLENGKIDSLLTAVNANDSTMRAFRYQQYQLQQKLKSQYENISDRLDSLGDFSDLPDY